jgi:hypothetical protein
MQPQAGLRASSAHAGTCGGVKPRSEQRQQGAAAPGVRYSPRQAASEAGPCARGAAPRVRTAAAFKHAASRKEARCALTKTGSALPPAPASKTCACSGQPHQRAAAAHVARQARRRCAPARRGHARRAALHLAPTAPRLRRMRKRTNASAPVVERGEGWMLRQALRAQKARILLGGSCFLRLRGDAPARSPWYNGLQL